MNKNLEKAVKTFTEVEALEEMLHNKLETLTKLVQGLTQEEVEQYAEMTSGK